ncbi:hypothetical protein LshimejAT787_0205200 [Lyophyllum shimeji]|uniref:Uncharacterized protein n=1 Tax=Lyophyllum shimeji TaxID=47721 RepID=A0A9P3PFC7_LYOSH|nr:hypothetical protein LshimejAT787_0205200 [Lyophyllum shimeji]
MSVPSIRIKVPGRGVSADSNSQSPMAEPSSRRRKPTLKRRLAVVSDAEDDDNYDQSHLDAATSSPTGTSSLCGRSHTVEGDSDVDVVHDGPAESGTHSPHPAEPSSSSASHMKKNKAKPTGDGPRPAKKKRVKVDDHSDEDYHVGAGSGVDDGEHIITSKRQPKPTAKAKSRVVKARRPNDGDELAKDARIAQNGKQPADATDSNLAAGTKRQRGASSKAEDANVDVVGDTDARADTQSPGQPKEPSPPPKKRKLPTIKKIKGAATTAGSTSTTKTSSTPAIAKPTPPKLPDLAIPPPAGARKTPALLGNTDFDLRNQSVYNELFKPAGGNTPRSGLSRREKDEERRKELDKMRDEARAKRLAEMASSFDLQAQSDKISRFEERLRMNRSSALFPNFLAAKWRELWELDKHKVKEQGSPEGRNGNEAEEREEGEMNEQPRES